VGFHDVHHEESRLTLVLFIELVERGNLPAERRSGVAAENQNDRPVPAKRGKSNPRRPIGSGEAEVRRKVTHVQAPGTGDKPKLLEGNYHQKRFRQLRHYFSEDYRLAHHNEQPCQQADVKHDDEKCHLSKSLHFRTSRKTLSTN
jgi:hypothetical protein